MNTQFELSETIYDIFRDVREVSSLLTALGKSLEADGSEYADGAYLLQKTSQDAAGKIRQLLEKLNPPKERNPL